jgi:hypothetical protein
MGKTKRKSIFNFNDWRGGYATNIPDELMQNNELRQAENCYWNNGLVKRQGISKYASLTGSAKGSLRVYTNDAEHTIIAVDDGSTVEFQQATTTTTAFATIKTINQRTATTSNFTFTTGKNVEFTALGDKVIAVNGTDRPAAIFPTSSVLYAMELDRYSEVPRATSNWYAGQFDGTNYTDDTTDAQDDGADDFYIGTSTATSGFYVACDFPFSKLLFTGVDNAGASVGGTYQYYNGSTWTNIGTMNSSALNAAGVEWGTATVTMEFERPLSTDGTMKWQKYDLDEGNLTQRYVVRTIFAGLSDPITCDKFSVADTHYLTQIISDYKPQTITTHKNHVFMAANNQVQIGAVNSITDWRANRWEYFFEGGNEIVGLITHDESLLVIKPGMIFAIDGTSWENWSTRTLVTGGSIARRGFYDLKGILWHIDFDGLYAFDGVRRIKVCSHIKDDINSYTLTDAAIGEYQNYLYLSFPTNSIVLMFDPDTFRMDQIGNIGEGRVSFYKYTPFLARGFQWNRSSDDNGYLLFLGTDYVGRAENGTAYDKLTSTIAINMQIQTKYFDFGNDQMVKLYNRVVPQVADASSTGSGQTYTFKMLKSDETGGASASIALSAGVGTGYHQKNLLVPGTIDGKLLGFYLQHNTAYSGKLMSVSVDTRARRY